MVDWDQLSSLNDRTGSGRDVAWCTTRTAAANSLGIFHVARGLFPGCPDPTSHPALIYVCRLPLEVSFSCDLPYLRECPGLSCSFDTTNNAIGIVSSEHPAGLRQARSGPANAGTSPVYWPPCKLQWRNLCGIEPCQSGDRCWFRRRFGAGFVPSPSRFVYCNFGQDDEGVSFASRL